MGRAFEYRRASKEKRWDKMSKVFPKLTRAITVAAREGGQDPESNPRLRAAIASAKAENMPKDNIETAIKRAAGRDAEVYAETAYEAKAAHGVLMIVDCATDNPTRTIANLKVIFKKEGGEIVQPGSLEFLFNRRTVVEFPVPEGRDLDGIELELIDHGLEELEVENGTVYVYGDFTSFGSLSKAVERLGIEEARASLRRLPTSPIELTESQMEDVERLIDKLEDDEDVQAVFTNIA